MYNDYLTWVHRTCPKCGGNTVIKSESKYALTWPADNDTLTSRGCPCREKWPGENWKSGFIHYNPASGIEPYFGYKLSLQTIIYAHSFSVNCLTHAEDIAGHDAATDKPTPADSKWAMVDRLPKWVKVANN